MKKKLALFDFDGTITNRDSFIEFIKFYKGIYSFYIGFVILSPLLFLYRIGVINNGWTKEIVFSLFFKNETYENFTEKCQVFSLIRIPKLVKPLALDAIKRHIANGDKVVIVTASFEDYLSGWCRTMDIDLIGTKIEIFQGRISGKLNGKNCYGSEKVVRLSRFLNLDQFSEIYAYGDSSGDLPLLEIAHHKYYKPFTN